jgi:hypothetical protein
LVETIRIEWPSGIVQELKNIAVKQFLTVTEPVFQISNPRMALGGFQMSIKGRVGARSLIQATSDLREWLLLGVMTNSTGALEFFDPGATQFPMRFYRALEIETAPNSPER